jgi:hypothetical protein
MDTDSLAKLIDRKLQVLNQLHQLSLRQVQFVEQGDVSSLIGLLAAKQRLLHPLQSIEDGLAPYRDQDPDGRAWRSPQHRQRTREVVDQCESVLRDIVRLETLCEQELVRRRDVTAAQLRGAQDAAQAVQAYATAAPSVTTQFDVSSET